VFEEVVMAARCSFCGSPDGTFNKVEGLFTVLMCADCQAARGYGSS
jgi:translation initiation factor 2 beta subunit (eIF-2beta)/eIF-5